ncbi:hypothetical protein EYF80_012623 [Liparis tanakae]|uniref:Uncharacterized protein n=1 Tax=Liparis tanakae TaxID=230148 RepID=A0A4Z2II85_9TELE|nr:hypothetical protein EYF80_012623 [Liparis tanakae]
MWELSLERIHEEESKGSFADPRQNQMEGGRGGSVGTGPGRGGSGERGAGTDRGRGTGNQGRPSADGPRGTGVVGSASGSWGFDDSWTSEVDASDGSWGSEVCGSDSSWTSGFCSSADSWTSGFCRLLDLRDPHLRRLEEDSVELGPRGTCEVFNVVKQVQPDRKGSPARASRHREGGGANEAMALEAGGTQKQVGPMRKKARVSVLRVLTQLLPAMSPFRARSHKMLRVGCGGLCRELHILQKYSNAPTRQHRRANNCPAVVPKPKTREPVSDGALTACIGEWRGDGEVKGQDDIKPPPILIIPSPASSHLPPTPMSEGIYDLSPRRLVGRVEKREKGEWSAIDTRAERGDIFRTSDRRGQNDGSH